jgi:uncharacterized protein YlxW (UPF0749 family)
MSRDQLSENIIAWLKIEPATIKVLNKSCQFVLYMYIYIYIFQIVALSGNVERSSSEQKMKLQHLESDSNQQIAQLDSRTRQVIDDLKNNIHTYQNHADVEREKLEQKLSLALDAQAQARDQLMVSV